MKVSFKELSKYVDLTNINPYDLADKLTFAGIEVEEVKKLSSANNLCIGQVIFCENMPESDHLHLTKVDVGNEILDIVCGAPNVRKGLKVIVAKVGAKLPGGEIKKGFIRGHESNGMLCSLLELGVDKKYLTQNQIDGIEELDDNATVGDTNVLEYLGLDDYVLDLKLLANRSDCNALLNVAKEISSIYECKLKDVDIVSSSIKKENIDFAIYSKTDKCKKFVAKIIKGIKIKDSPSWLKYALRSMGVRSINNIVDIGNYVMLLTGQPLHIYDLDKVCKNELYADLSSNEKFTALDDKTYDLLDEDIVIKSGETLESLAGVMGSKISSDSNETQNIIIESALFDSKCIRLTSNRLGLSSESSQRFVKGIDPTNQEFAIDVATHFIELLCGGEIASQTIVFDNLNHKDVVISSSYKYINNRLGTNFDNSLIKKTLNRVFIKIKDLDDDNFEAYIPHHRIDITDQADLSEEVIRILGFDKIQSKLPVVEMLVGGLSDEKKKENLVSDLLINNGFYKVINYSLVSPDIVNDFDILNDKEVKILNPLTVDHSVLRKSLIPSLLNNINYNLNHKNEDFKIFEISNVYFENKNVLVLSAALCGNNLYHHQLNKIKYSFYDLKGILESICDLLGISYTRYQLLNVEKENKYFNFGKSAYFKLNGKVIGVFGEIHPNIYEKYEIKQSSNVLVMQINLTELFATKTSIIKSKELSKFLDVRRDLALICDKNLSIGQIIKEISKCSSLISDVEIFDIFESEQLKSNNKKSLAFSITFTAYDSTLKEDEINQILNKVISNLETNLKVELRK